MFTLPIPARGRRLLGPLALVVICLSVVSCAGTPPQPGAFYDATDAQLRGHRPGDILRTESMTNAPAGASTYRVLYVSTGLKGQPIAVSGVIIVPNGTAPASGRKILAWTHGTTGIARPFAPSLLPILYKEIGGLAEFIARGFVITATDYPGLGTVGPHPYLVGLSEGRAALDSVRAAGRLPQAHAGNKFAVWGHSQGGHAALFTGQLARGYAPDISLVGVAAAAPATDLGVLLSDIIGTPVGRILGSYALVSWSRVYGAPISTLASPADIPILEKISTLGCVGFGQIYQLSRNVKPLKTGFPLHDPSKLEPWRGIIARNCPGATRAGAPLFISQGTTDDIVRPAVTAQFVKKLRARGETVHFVQLDQIGHIPAATVSAPAAVSWIDDRFAGTPALNETIIQSK